MRVVVASANPGKIREIEALLAGSGIELLAQSALGVVEAAETGLSFVENALLKARNAAAHTGLAAIGEDSGLEVDALDGAPGIYSARYAGPAASDADNVTRLLAQLDGVTNRSARFRCLAVYLRHAADPAPAIHAGSWEGRIASAPAGSHGFGYDPVFVPAGLTQTSAQMPAQEKNRVSHRAAALRALAVTLRRECAAR